jgi:hypothetical protein
MKFKPFLMLPILTMHMTSMVTALSLPPGDVSLLAKSAPPAHREITLQRLDVRIKQLVSSHYSYGVARQSLVKADAHRREWNEYQSQEIRYAQVTDFFSDEPTG